MRQLDSLPLSLSLSLFLLQRYLVDAVVDLIAAAEGRNHFRLHFREAHPVLERTLH
jgi:hypothetical protein